MSSVEIKVREIYDLEEARGGIEVSCKEGCLEKAIEKIKNLEPRPTEIRYIKSSIVHPEQINGSYIIYVS